MGKTAEGRKRLAERDKRLEVREASRQNRIVEKRERVEAGKKQREENRKAEEDRSRARGMREAQEWPKYTGQGTNQEDQNEQDIITPEEFVRIKRSQSGSHNRKEEKQGRTAGDTSKRT